MEEISPAVPPERSFGHAVVVWRIESFTLSGCTREIVIESTEFSVTGPQPTRWKLGLSTSVENSKLMIYLQRCPDGVERGVKIFWKAVFLDDEGEGLYIAEHENFVTEGLRQTVETISAQEIISRISGSIIDQLIVNFSIIVHFGGSMNFPKPYHPGLRSLAHDLGNLGSTAHFYDVTGKMPGDNIKLHRAILRHRSNNMDKLVATSRGNTFPIFLSDVNAVNNLFSYLYTADLTFLFNPPTIAIAEYIEQFDFPELRTCYPKERLSLETVLHSNHYVFKWTIRDFESLNHQIGSRVMSEDGMESSYKLRLFPKGPINGTEAQKRYVYLEATVLECTGYKNVYLDFSALDDEGKKTYTRRTHGKVTAGDMLSVPFLRIGSTTMGKAVVNNVLNICFTVNIGTGDVIPMTKETYPPTPLAVTNDQTFALMSDMMTSLLESGDFSDINLVVRDDAFMAHRCVLVARSSAFLRMLRKTAKGKATFSIPYIEKQHFRALMVYLYTGIIVDYSIDTLIHLCDASETFGVPSLKPICVDLLVHLLTPDNVCELLIMADEMKEPSLKSAALRLLSYVSTYVKQLPGWTTLRKMKPRFFLEVEEFLKDSDPNYEPDGPMSESEERVSEVPVALPEQRVREDHVAVPELCVPDDPEDGWNFKAYIIKPCILL